MVVLIVKPKLATMKKSICMIALAAICFVGSASAYVPVKAVQDTTKAKTKKKGTKTKTKTKTTDSTQKM